MDSSPSFIDAVAALTQDEKNTQLLKAAKAGDVDKVGVLLQAGAAIEATDRLRNTALIIAAESGHTAVVKQLLSKGANIEAVNEFFVENALILAACNGHTSVVECLLLNNANINAINQYRETALMRSVWKGHTAVLAKLIEAGADIEAATRSGHTALMLAVHENHQDAGFLLLNALSSERVEILSREPNLAPLIQSFRRTIGMAKRDMADIFMGMFSARKQKTPAVLMNPILNFIFPSWLVGRKEVKVGLKILLDKMPKAVISAAAEEPLAQAPVVVTFSGTANTADAARKRKRSDSLPAAAAEEPKEEGLSTKKHKPNGNM